jgi:hypothetical protein
MHSTPPHGSAVHWPPTAAPPGAPDQPSRAGSMDTVRLATRVEPGQASSRPMVGRELQGGLSGLYGLSRALKNWSDSQSGHRKGRPMGFPRWKRARSRKACRFTTGAIRVLDDRKHVQLPRIGVLKTHESTRKLARRVKHGTARIVTATVSQTADRWYVSLTCEVQRRLPTSNGRDDVVGVDVGIRHLAVLSTGTITTNPVPLNARCGRCGGLTGSYIAAGHDPGVATRLVAGSPGSMRERPTCAATRSTSSPRSRPRRRRPGRASPPARLQDRLARQPAAASRPILSLVQDLLGLRLGESQARPGRAHLHLRGLRASTRPGFECCPQSRQARRARRPEWLGDVKRPWSRP